MNSRVEISTGSVTEELVQYVVRQTWDDLPHEVRVHALHGAVNIVGCMMGGASLPEVQQIDEALSPFSGTQTTIVPGAPFRRDPLHACLINGVSANVRTFDDTHTEAVIHPSGSIAAAALSASQMCRTTGKTFLLAYALGVEVACRLSLAMSVEGESFIGWSQTSVCNAIGAAIAAAKVFGLNAEQTHAALTIASSQAGGLRSAQGTTASPMMMGSSGQIGFRAAVLARANIKGRNNSLEAPYGFLAAFSHKWSSEALVGELGSRYEMLRNLFKPYPCGIVIHSVIDACLELKHAHDLDSRDISSISMQVNKMVLVLTDRRHPETSLLAQVSTYHWAAACLLVGKADLSSVDPKLLNDPEIRRLRDIMTLNLDETVPLEAVQLNVTLKDGRKLSHRIDAAVGSVSNPMTESAIKAKFLSQAVIGKGEDEAASVYDALCGLPEADDVEPIFAQLKSSKAE